VIQARLRLICLTLAVFGTLRPAAFARNRKLKDPTDLRIATQVLRSLLASPVGETMPRLRYRVVLVSKLIPNAFAERDGTVYITEGLLPVFEGDRGVWAAVIGHELGHILLAHREALERFEGGIRQAYESARADGYDQGPVDWPAADLSDRAGKPKPAKEQEYEADFIGLMLMADAGYQPGYSVILEKRLLFGVGSEPKFVAFFSHHPRLQSREERTVKVSGMAMDIFRSRWPDAAKSPGGNLPPYGTIGPWTFEQADGGRELVFRVPFQVHRSAGMAIRVAGFFLDGDLRVRSAIAKYRATDGSLVINRFVRGAESESSQVTLQVPTQDLILRHHSVLAVVFLMADGRPLDLGARHVHLPDIPLSSIPAARRDTAKKALQ
jgi:hypothetical protein